MDVGSLIRTSDCSCGLSWQNRAEKTNSVDSLKERFSLEIAKSNMNDVSETSWKQLPYVDVHVDEVEPRQGVLDLVRRLRPHWKLQDVQMKASAVTFAVWMLQILDFIDDDPCVIMSCTS